MRNVVDAWRSRCLMSQMRPRPIQREVLDVTLQERPSRSLDSILSYIAFAAGRYLALLCVVEDPQYSVAAKVARHEPRPSSSKYKGCQTHSPSLSRDQPEDKRSKKSNKHKHSPPSLSRDYLGKSTD